MPSTAKTLSRVVETFITKNRKLDIIAGKVHGDRNPVKLTRYVMRNLEAFREWAKSEVLARDIKEEMILEACSILAGDQVKWEIATCSDVEKAYSSQFAFGHKFLIDENPQTTLDNISEFSKALGSCMTPNPRYSLVHGDDNPMDCAVQVFRRLKQSTDNSNLEFYNQNGLNVCCLVAVKKEQAGMTFFRSLVWVIDGGIYLDKVYHNGNGADLRSFQSFLAGIYGSQLMIREHNHLIDSEDGDSVYFVPYCSSITSMVSGSPELNCSITDSMPYMDSFRYSDVSSGDGLITLSPDDETVSHFASTNGYVLEYENAGTSCCVNCGSRCEEESMFYVDNRHLESGLYCEDCYCENICSCEECGSEIAIQEETYFEFQCMTICSCCVTQH